MTRRHHLSALFAPRSVALIVARTDSGGEPAWVAALRERFADGPASRAGAIATRTVALADDTAADPARAPPGVCPEAIAPGAGSGDIDLALIATPVADAVAALHCAARLGADAALVFERGDAGQARVLAETARALKIRLLGPGSMGVQVPPLRLDASRFGGLPSVGNVALVSQSGVLAGDLLDWAGDTTIGFSLTVSLGFEADVDLAQVLDYLAEDGRTKAVIVYMEAVTEARGFMSALRALASIKPVVVLKGGRDSSTGGKAPRTHSGAIVAADAVYAAALRRAGAVQVRLFAQLLTSVRYLAARRWPVGKRLAIVSNGHGPATLAADQTAMQGIELPEFSAQTAAALRDCAPGVAASNPLDLGVDADPRTIAAVVEAVAADPNSDGLLVLLSPSQGRDMRAITDRVVVASRGLSKPLFGCLLGDRSVRGLRGRLDAAGLPVFSTPEAAVDAFSTVATFHQNQQLLQQVPRPLSEMERPDIEAGRAIVAAALADGRKVLTEVESKALLEAFRIPVSRTVLARDVAEAVQRAPSIGYPLVLKIVSAGVAHKSDVGGVALNVRNVDELRLQFAAILESVHAALPQARLDGVSLQPMVRSRGMRELYVGVFRNRLFGPVIAFGAGGTRVEMMRDTALALPPLNGFLARNLIARTRAASTLGSFHGTPAVDEEAMVRVLVRVSEMVCQLPELAEMDINPVLLGEQGAIAVDARVVLDCAPVPPGPRYGHMAVMPYPSHLARELALADGRSCLLRPIQAEDGERLQDFTRGLSPRSRYFRFISALTELSPKMLARYTQIDYDRELALIAVVDGEGRAPAADAMPAGDGQVIGVARYLLTPDRETCEFAIAVGDAWQGQGLGAALMRALIDEARQRGLRQMEGYVLAINAPMIRLMGMLGFVIERDPEDESFKRVWLALDSAAAA